MPQALSSQAWRALDRDGYVVIDLLDGPTVDVLLAQYRSIGIDDQVPFTATCNDLDRRAAIKVDRHLREVIEPIVHGLLPDHRTFLASFISKGVGSPGRLDFHQDLTYTDEREVRSVLLWIPLVDTDQVTGALEVVPGSHRWTEGIRPAGADELPTRSFQAGFAALARTLPMRRGQALVYDPALVHGSAPNLSVQPRPVVALATAPTGAALVHFHHEATGPDIVGHLVDPDYYVRQTLFERPEGYPAIDPWAAPVEAAAFCPHLATAVDVEPASAAPSRPPSPAALWSPLLSPMAPDQVVGDRGADLRLRRDGFIVVPLVSASSARSLDRRIAADPTVAFDATVAPVLRQVLVGVELEHGRFRTVDRHDGLVHRVGPPHPGPGRYSALVALSEGCGVSVVRNSHRVRARRGSRRAGGDADVTRRLTRVDLEPGDVMVMDRRLVRALGSSAGPPQVRVGEVGLAAPGAQPSVDGALTRVEVVPAELAGLLVHLQLDSTLPALIDQVARARTRISAR